MGDYSDLKRDWNSHSANSNPKTSSGKILHTRMKRKDYGQSFARVAGYEECTCRGDKGASKRNGDIIRAVWIWNWAVKKKNSRT